MIERLYSAAILNAVANDPAIVRACAPGYQDLDFSDFLTRPGNIALGGIRGVAIFAMQPGEPGVYAGHYLLRPRMPDKLQFSREALHWLFDIEHASAIVGRTPRENLAARMTSRALGFRPTGESVDSFGRSCIDYRLERQTWATLSAA